MERLDIKPCEIETLITTKHPKQRNKIPQDFEKTKAKLHGYSFTNNKNIYDLIAFTAFVVQTSSVVLLIRYSKMHTRMGSLPYANASIIASAEIGKISVGIFYCLYQYIIIQNQPIITAILSLYNDIFSNKKTLVLMAVPSIIYSVQNFLMYMALGIIDSSIYQIIVQLKTFTTACFGMCLLSKRYTLIQWISFLLLSAGVVIANLSVIKATNSTQGIKEPIATDLRLTGLLYVFGTTITSGFAGTFMELQLKGNKNNIFIQNIHLSMFMLMGCIINGYLTEDLQQIAVYGFLHGYTKIVWLIVILNIFGGYFVALVIKRASTMIKTFLSGIAILLIIIESYVFLGDLSMQQLDFFGAVFLVLLANYLYSKEKDNQRKLISNDI